jgi:hypothetical protein
MDFANSEVNIKYGLCFRAVSSSALLKAASITGAGDYAQQRINGNV